MADVRTGSGGAERERTPLTGRDAELRALRTAVTRVAEGAPGAVLLTGPSGVGKTRLAREALTIAERAGFGTFVGRARDLGHEVAYAPVVEAFGSFLRAMDPRPRESLVGDLPQLALLFGGLDLAAPAPLGDPALERARLLEGLSQLIERLARERPLALLLDDLHRADAGTAAVVRALIAALADRPILLVLTARSDEPDGDHLARLGEHLAACAGWVQRIAVEPLGDQDSADLVGHVLGGSVDERLSGQIRDRCAGRPLLLEAVARTLAESGRLTERDGVLRLSAGGVPLPVEVSDQLRGRLVASGEDERAALRVLAVAGSVLAPGVLACAAGLHQRATLAALDRLHRRWLVTERSGTDGDDGYELAHGLLRDVLLGELSPPARQQVHADLVEALTAARADDPRIAEHVLQSGSLIAPPVALEHLVRGAEHARLLGATEDAARYLQGALEIARRHPSRHDRAGLLGELAAVYGHLGDHALARERWHEAVAEYRARGEPAAVARAERELAMLVWSQGGLADARAHLAAAEEALSDLEPSHEHGWLAHAQMIIGVRVGDGEAVRAAAARLRELAAGLRSPTLAAHAHLAEGAVAYARADYVASAEHDRRALEEALAADEPLLAIRAHDQLSVVAAAELDLAALQEHSRQSVEIAQRLGAPMLSGWPRGRVAVANLLAGDWDAAMRAISELDADAERLGDPRGRIGVRAMRAWILVHRGRLEDAEELLAHLRSAAPPGLQDDRNIYGIVALAEADLALAQGDPERARRDGAQLPQPRFDWLQPIRTGLLGEALVSSGEIDAARGLARRARDVRSCATEGPGAIADWVEGLADAADGDRSAAAQRLRAAADAFDRLGLPFQHARARLAIASVQAQTDSSAAIELAGEALATFERLDAPIQAREARELLRELGVTPSRGRRSRPTSTALSARELEVSRLVASGLTNAEVATRLWISPRTVTTHLDRIYAKLGLSSRVALTRYLADSGQLDAEEPDTAG